MRDLALFFVPALSRDPYAPRAKASLLPFDSSWRSLWFWVPAQGRDKGCGGRREGARA